MVSEMCGYDTKLICLKNRRCLTCHIYLKRTKEFDERLTEPRIREKIYEIIEEGLEFYAQEGGNLQSNTELIKEKIQKLLNKHEAVLVYQP